MVDAVTTPDHGADHFSSGAAVVTPQQNHVLIRKTADTTRNNTTTRTDDPHLKIAVAENEIWLIDFCLLWSGGTVSDIAFSFGGPAAATLKWTILAGDPGTSVLGLFEHEGADSEDAEATAGVVAGWIKAIYIGGANAGTLALQWAQDMGVMENTTLLAGSYLFAHKLG